MVGPMSEVHNASEANQFITSSSDSPDTPIPALAPPVINESTGGEDRLQPLIANNTPSLDSALPKPQRGEIVIAQGEALGVDSPVTLSPEGAKESKTRKTLDGLLRAESTLAAAIATLDPLSPAFIQSLQALATLRYHITAARADIAAAQNPKYLKELTKATAIVQRDHLRLAREHSANERERLCREREDRAAQRANEKQEHQERMAKHKIHLEELRLRREQEKTYNNIHKQSHKNLQLESNAIAARNASNAGAPAS